MTGAGPGERAGRAGDDGGDRTDRGDDGEVERALRELAALSGSGSVPFQELAGGAEAVRAAAVRLVGQAESTVDVILASATAPGLTAGAGAGGLLGAAAGPARLRVLCSPRTYAPDLPRARAHVPAAVDVRIGRLRAVDVVVVDGRVALARSDSGRPGAIVVRSRPVVRAVGDLFDDVWRGARPPPDPVNLGGPDRAEFAGRVLRLLYSGCTDEAAARELDVSVRTYRRCVAEIVAAVGARSRFQAGMRAAAAGLLRPPP
jgi:hypothetical protein